MKKFNRCYLYIVLAIAIFITGCGNGNGNGGGNEDKECEHDLMYIEGEKSTCSTHGFEDYQVCTKCGEKFGYVELPLLEHRIKQYEGKEATCKETGWEAFESCQRCDYTTFKEIPALGHDIVHVEKVTPDCMHIGHEEYEYCTRCDYKTEVHYINPEPHDLVLVSTGEDNKTYKCNKCEETITMYNNPLNKEISEQQDLDVLLVGNSYTNYNTLMTCFKHVVEGQGIAVNVVKVAYGSQYLYDYIQGPEGDHYADLYTATRKHFDVVFLQEQSTNPITNMTNFFNSTRTLCDYFKAMGTEVIMYATWGVPDGNGQINTLGLKDSEEMTQLLTRAYEAIAEELNITTSPVGTAFSYVYKNHPEDKALLYASLSNQHPSAIGTYIAALCHYGRLYGRSVKGINFKFNDYVNATDITWHADSHNPISEEMQTEIEEAVDKALWGGSIVKEEYKVNSKNYK